MRVAIYARVSTAGNGQSPEMQLRELREYVERCGWTGAGDHVDVRISGAKDSRPELNRLVAGAASMPSWSGSLTVSSCAQVTRPGPGNVIRAAKGNR